MEKHATRLFLGGLGIGLGILGATLGCEPASEDAGLEVTLSALMDDGDAAAIAPGAMARPAPTPPLPRFCPDGDCTRAPLAFWRLDDCNPYSTELQDTAFTTPISHPAFRAVSAACVAGASGQGVRLAADDDIVYAPDQPDFGFSGGLTAAAWINPDRVTGTQTLVRKRLDGSSSFLLAIEGRRVHFVLRLTSGRLVDVSAPVQARRFTHVAGTYDGREAILYLDGAAAARARAVGSIAPGVGPVFVGNDANGRRLDGVVDEIWLNTLAAPADVVRALTCIRHAPLATLSPGESSPQVAGTPVPYQLSITNQNSASCPAEGFQFFASQLFPLSADVQFGEVTAASGQTARTTINVRSSRMAEIGTYPFQYLVFDEADFQFQATAQASYVVGVGPVACDGSAPQTAQIIGSPFSPAGAPYTFSAPGLAAPVVTVVNRPDGSIQALQAVVDPGVTSDPANSYLGFGTGFGNPPCVDASAYVGVRFTLTGDLGTCGATFSVIVSQDNSTANGPFGTCPAGGACVPPQSAPIHTGTNQIRFDEMTGGTPLPTVDATALNGVQWTLTVPTDGVTAPCQASFTITDVSFIRDGSVSQVNNTFDRDTQGWQLSTFDDGTLMNLAVRVPPGGAFATLAFDPADGDPAPGSLRVTAPFTALEQAVDPIVGLPFPQGLDLTGRTLHARVRLVSGAFPEGAVQFHASSGETFVYASTFVGADQFALGQWVPVELDLAAAAASTPGFDPARVVQIGVQFVSGFAAGGTPFTGSNAVFEIDTVTD